MEQQKKKISKKNKIIILVSLFLACMILVPVSMNCLVITISQKYILDKEKAANFDADCILVLGAYVKDDNSLSLMLEDRVIYGIDLYKSGAGKKLLLSGDHGRDEYDEVNAMKAYSIEKGVIKDDIFLDHAGFSTYESVVRAKEIFGADKIIIVTQQYHLYRAVYLARSFGLDAYGVASDPRSYGDSLNFKNNCREFLARCKDFCMSIIKPDPTYLGEAIPINGSGTVTFDKD